MDPTPEETKEELGPRMPLFWLHAKLLKSSAMYSRPERSRRRSPVNLHSSSWLVVYLRESKQLLQEVQ